MKIQNLFFLSLLGLGICIERRNLQDDTTDPTLYPDDPVIDPTVD